MLTQTFPADDFDGSIVFREGPLIVVVTAVSFDVGMEAASEAMVELVVSKLGGEAAASASPTPTLASGSTVEVDERDGRYMATADLAKDSRDTGVGDTPRQAVRAALHSLDEPYATQMAAGVEARGGSSARHSRRSLRQKVVPAHVYGTGAMTQTVGGRTRA